MTTLDGTRIEGWQDDEGPMSVLRRFYRAPQGASFATWVDGERYRVWCVTGDGDFWTWFLVVSELTEIAVRDLGNLDREGYPVRIKPHGAGLMVEIEGRWVE